MLPIAPPRKYSDKTPIVTALPIDEPSVADPSPAVPAARPAASGGGGGGAGGGGGGGGGAAEAEAAPEPAPAPAAAPAPARRGGKPARRGGST